MAAELTTPLSSDLVRRTRPWALYLTLAAVAVIRLLQMRGGGAPDEGGFLVLGGQWHANGTSLYGNYWVDRPPLLITIFGIAHALGGLVALRLLGIAAALSVIALLHSTSRRVYGERAAAWTAVVAGALLVSPLYGSIDVNGELIALPFIALGLRFAVEAVYASDVLVARGAALGAGLAAIAAVQIKQNLADVVVFAAVCWVIAWRSKRIDGRRLGSLIGFAALGVVLGYAAVMLWALAHGTSPAAAYEATYPFRVKAAAVLAEDTRQESGTRLTGLGRAFLGSLAPLLLVVTAFFAARRSRDPAVFWALAVTFAFGTFSVLAGGSYWLHYLLETLPAVALAAGALAAAAPRVVRPIGVLMAVSGLVAGVAVMVNPTPTPGTVIGKALASAAQPGDTAIAAFGDAEIMRASGLTSPYPYLWSLPARVRDPHLDLLRGVLAGPTAPDWMVLRDSRTIARLARTGVLPVVKDRYRVVGNVCGRKILLRDDLQRPAPVAAPGADCGS